VEIRALLREQGAVRDFMGQRVLERVLAVRREAYLVQELRRLQPREAPMERIGRADGKRLA